MNKQALVTLLIGLVLGGLITYSFIATSLSKSATPNEMHSANQIMNHKMDEHSMADMNEALKGKTGDEFDKEFIIQMIEHHQGAIDMANQVKTNAKHDELKKMADDIISAQTSEIEMMKQWQKEWGYTQ